MCVPRADVVSAVAGAVLFLLALVHIHWAFRGTGVGAFIPSRRDGTPLFRPSRLASVVVAVALTLASFLLIGQGGWIHCLTECSRDFRGVGWHIDGIAKRGCRTW